MALSRSTRRCALLLSLAAPALALIGCAPPPPPPPTPTMLVVSSLAATVPVANVDRTNGDVILNGANGFFNVRNNARGGRSGVRAGSRVQVQIDEGGTVRLGPPQRVASLSRLPITIQAIEPGGGSFVASGIEGRTETLVVQDRAISAFVTRVGPGTAATVTIRQADVPPPDTD